VHGFPSVFLRRDVGYPASDPHCEDVAWRWERRDLSRALSVSLPTIKRLESKPGAMAAQGSTVTALRKALEAAGIEFIHENGGGPGVRLRNRQSKKA
jgi:hypothetical protein